MDDELKLAKNACDKAFAEFNAANLNAFNAKSKEEKEKAADELRKALKNFDEAHKAYAKLQLDRLMAT